MCCFSRPVKSVTNTRIFARDSEERAQFLVYEMKFSSNENLAMILPIPVPKSTPEESVRFINLEKFPAFFTEMESGFPQPRSGMGGMGMAGSFGGGAPLKVVDVGAFEASFVPTVDDFKRLDERFRLPAGTWDKLPQYQRFGFAVFKLKPGNNKAHPMAFEFPRANPNRLFFPTVHIHDGQVHKKANFDHTLYAQFGENHDRIGAQNWNESLQPAGMFMKVEKCE